MAVSLHQGTRSALGRPRRAFTAIAAEILPDWDISLAFVTPRVAQKLNRSLRGKSYTPNVLSSALGDRHGEVVICPSLARREAPRYGLSPEDYVLYLFIHGILHISGRDHGARMERCEQELMARHASRGFSVLPYDPTDSHRGGHRHLSGKDSGRRGGVRQTRR